MITMLLALALAGLDDPVVSDAVARWQDAVSEIKRHQPPPSSSKAERLRYLVLLDEVTRQNLWVMDDPKLTPAQQRQIGSILGPAMSKVDAETTATLKTLLPRSGWFDNKVDGRQITHGAWLIAQHSPDPQFRSYALSQMSKKVRSGGVDARDYALTYDRVQRDNGLPQRYGSQFMCVNGHYSLEPIEYEAKVDMLREKIGWSQTLAETKGDNEIGKPCAQ